MRILNLFVTKLNLSINRHCWSCSCEGALPYPPGVLCVVPGERWSPTAQKYFLALEEGINTLPGFAPEIQGVYLQKDPDGRTRAYGYVLTDY